MEGSRPTDKCCRCGEPHDIITCPYVKAVEFDDTGENILRLEFLTPADYGPAPAAQRSQTTAAGEVDYPRMGPKQGA